MIGLESLLTIGGKLIDKLIPDPAAKAQAQLELAKMAQDGELARMADETRRRELELVDSQQAHKEQQETIRSGDNASDEYVRHTRPMMARQSWYAGATFIFCFEVAKVIGYGQGAQFEIAMTVLAPALAYMGFRTFDKFAKWKK
jgi:Holin of 3TMs, for gene-transfer release